MTLFILGDGGVVVVLLPHTTRILCLSPSSALCVYTVGVFP